MIDNVVIIGAGSLGTALAQILSRNVGQVTIQARRVSVAEEITVKHRNSEYFPTIRLNHNIRAINTFDWDFSPEIIFFCVPSSTVREISSAISDQHSVSDSIIVSTAKGIEYPSLKRMSQIIEENQKQKPVVFSGPTFASELILHSPTAVTIAAQSENNLECIRETLASEFLIVEKSNDVVGTELCSILKNIYSIGFGICEGMDLNENAKYAFFTKSFQEMKKIVANLGGISNTVDNYCGFGDLTLTSASRKSRNYTLGMLYGKKIIIDEMSSGILFEGKKSVTTIKQLCSTYSEPTPILDFVNSVVIEKRDTLVAFSTLWNTLRTL